MFLGAFTSIFCLANAWASLLVILSRHTAVYMRLYKKIGCRHYGRVDLRLDINNCIKILELNTLPGMTDTSLLPKAANSYGINYSELVKKIIKLATSYE